MPFRVLLAVRAMSTLSTGLNAVVCAWLVLSVGGAAVHLAVLAALAAGVGIPAVFFGGPLVDRWSHRTLTLATELVRVVPVAVIPLLAATDHLALWHVMVAGTWVSAVHAVSVAAYGAMLPELVGPDRLVQVNGTWQAVSQAGVFVGAALGGVAIPVLGVANALLLEVAGRLLAAAGLLWLRGPRRTVSARSRGFLWRDMAEAWAVLRARPTLLWLTVFGGVPGSLMWAANAVLPAFVKNDNGMTATEYGLVDAAWGVGAFVAGAACARLPAFGNSRRGHVSSLVATGVTLATLSLAHDLWSALVLAFAVGATSLTSLVLFQSAVQAAAPRAFVGRILAVSQLVLSALWLAVALGVGALTVLTSTRVVIVLWGLAITVCGFGLHALLRRVPVKEAI